MLRLVGDLAGQKAARQHAVRERHDRHLAGDGNFGAAGVGGDHQLSGARLHAGRQPGAHDAHPYALFLRELHHVRLTGRGRFHLQPIAIAGHAANDQPMPVVGQADAEVAVLAGLEVAELHLQRRRLQARRRQIVGRQPRQESIDAAIGIALRRGLSRDSHQIGPAEPAQECRQHAVLEQVPGFLPVLLTGEGELVEILAGVSRREI